ncbi:hypothetical protein HELRODRAFT_151554, partial [Helobdella robusta]|uniref:Rho-GAP domain-containing protein n=1 Tax=Helobdella robusta TaxID=6412 RepID=T1EKL1_HELRO
PILISSCIEELEKRGICYLGLYRVSGVYAAINKLKIMFDEVGQLATSSVHIITGVIKLFFRELPDSLIPISRYHTFINSRSYMEPDEQSEHLIREVGRLPICNLKTLTFLLNHLNRVANQKECNSMTLGNLATIFGPNLFRQP